MKIIRLCAATIVFPLCFLPLSCDLFGGDVVYLASQAEEIFNELMGQSHGILPDSYVLYDVSKTYTGDESEEDKIDGSARLYGTYTYTWDDYYISSDSHKEVRSWTYDELKFSYDDYKRFSNDITIVSGSLTVDGSRQMETQYTTSGYTSYSTEPRAVRFTCTAPLSWRASAMGRTCTIR